MGGSLNDVSAEVCVFPNRQVGVVGTYVGPADFDDGPGLDTLSRRNGCFIARYGPTGNRLWSKEIGGVNAKGHGIAALRDGGIAVVGKYTGANDFDPGPGVVSLPTGGIYANSGFVARYDSLGNLLWARSLLATSFGDFINMYVTEDPTGRIVALGTFEGDHDPNPPSFYTLNAIGTGGDIFFVKYSATGTFQSAYRLGVMNEYDIVRAFHQDAQGNFYLTGMFWSTGLAGDLYVYKMSMAGPFVYSYSVTTSNTEMGRGITLLPNGNVLVSGEFWGPTDFDPGPGNATLTPQGSRDIFLLELSPTGTFVSVKQLGNASSAAQSYGLNTDTLGNLYIAGFFTGTVDMDPGTGVYNVSPSGNQNTAYVVKYDNWVPQQVLEIPSGPVSHDEFWFHDHQGGLYRAGSFSSTTNISNLPGTYNVTSNGLSDGYVVKYQLCPPPAMPTNTTLSQNMTACSGHPTTLSASGTGTLGWYSAAAGGTYLGGGGSYTTPPLTVPTTFYVQDSAGCRGPRRAITVGIAQPSASAVTASACNTYTLNGQTYTSSGTYTQTLVNARGCDSTLTLNLTVRSNTSHTITASACNSYTLNGQTYTSSGSYTQHLTNAAGCDSALTLNLTVRQPSSGTLTANVCNSYTVNGQTYTSSGTFTQNLTNVYGCDSTLTLNLTIRHSTTRTLTANVCNTYTLNGQTYTSSGSYVQHLTNSQGCDSAITLNLTVRHSTSGTLTTSACNSYTLNGQSYTTSGTFTQNLTNSQGCDSTLTLNLTIHHNSAHVINANVCNQFTLNGQTYTSSGTYTQHLTNAHGCDSALTLVLQVRQGSSHTVTVDTCAGFYTFNGQTYTQSGNHTQVLQNAVGCDSVLTLALTLHGNTGSTLTASACGSYLSPAGHVYTLSGTYRDTIPNSAGCDSIITIMLGVTHVTTGVTVSGGTLTAQAFGAQYQWIHCDSAAVPGANGQSFTPTVSGNYAVIVTQNACSDTSACNAVIVNGVALPLPRPQLWPNPSSGWVNLDFGQWIEGDVTVLNALGQVVGAAALTGGRAQVALPVASGPYWVQVLDRDGRRGMWQVLRL